MKKFLVILLSFYSVLGISADLKEVLLEIALDGGTGDLTLGSGIQIADHIVLTVNHLIAQETRNLSSERFRRDETIKTNQSTTESEYVDTPNEKSQNQQCIDREFHSVLLANNNKDTFVIKNDCSRFSYVRVYKIVSYDQNEPLEEDPIQILLLTSEKPELPEKLRPKFLNEKWSENDMIFSSLKIAFSIANNEKAPWTISNVLWERHEPAFALAHNKVPAFTIAPIHSAGGMSGGGIFESERLVGLLSGDSFHCEVACSDAKRINLYEKLFKRYSWDMTSHEEPNVTKFISNKGFSGVFVKELNFENLKKAIQRGI